MATFTIRDRSGNAIGSLSDGESAGAGCVGCLGLSLIITVLYGAVCFYQIVQARLANHRIEAQRVVLAQDTLDSYAGKYDYRRYKIKIERRGGKLFNISPDEFCELVPISTEEFVYKSCVRGFQGRARFEQDGRGKKTMIVIHQDKRTEQAIKVN